MSEFLRRYLEIGLQDIVSIDYDQREDQSGFQEENTRETVVARKGAEYVKLSVHLRRKFGPSGGEEFRVTSEEPIPKDRYNALKNSKEVMDTPAVLEAIAAEDARDEEICAKAQALHQKIGATAPRCPKCGGPVEKKDGRRGWFWSCCKFPNCDGTASFSSVANLLQKELSKLHTS